MTNNVKGMRKPMLRFAKSRFNKKNAASITIAGIGEKNSSSVDLQSPSLGPAVIEQTMRTYKKRKVIGCERSKRFSNATNRGRRTCSAFRSNEFINS